jgi:hypothetical protein
LGSYHEIAEKLIFKLVKTCLAHGNHGCRQNINPHCVDMKLYVTVLREINILSTSLFKIIGWELSSIRRCIFKFQRVMKLKINSYVMIKRALSATQ